MTTTTDAVYVGPGCRAASLRPGDLILTHGRTVVHRFVQVGQRARLGLARVGTLEQRRRWCRWDHVAIYVGLRSMPAWDEPVPCVVEALPGLVRVTPLDAYDGREYVVVNVDRCATPDCRGHTELAADTRDREQIVAYAEDCIGLEYGLFGHYIGMTLTTLSGGGLTFSGAQQEICSSMAAQAQVRSFHTFDRPAPCVMPADLCRHYFGDAVPPND